jgi:phage protein D
VDGQPLRLDRAAALVRVETDLDEQLFARCTLLLIDPRGELISGDLFGSGASVKVEVGFPGARRRVFEGEVVALEPSFLKDKPPSLRVVCFEKLHRLALSQMTRSLHDVDDNQIVQQIAQSHGLQAEGPAGTREHALQANVSDAVFLRRMAQKHGGHVRVVGRKLIVGPPSAAEEVRVRPGEGVGKVRLRINANQQVGEVTAHGWDPRTRREIVGRARPQGKEGDGAREHGGSASIALAGKESLPSDTATAEAMAKARMRKLVEGFRTLQLQMTGDPRILPGAVLHLDGFGVPIDARYRVQSAQHVWDRFGYRVRLEGVFAGRNKPPRKAPARRDGDPREESCSTRRTFPRPRWRTS